VGPRDVLEAVVKRKIPSPRRESNSRNSDRPARSLVAVPTELSRLLNCVVRRNISFTQFS
jgi:hypothetical protein